MPERDREQPEQVLGDGIVDVPGASGGEDSAMRQVEARVDVHGQSARGRHPAGGELPQGRRQAHQRADVPSCRVGEAFLLVRHADVGQRRIDIRRDPADLPVEAAPVHEHQAVALADLRLGPSRVFLLAGHGPDGEIGPGCDVDGAEHDVTLCGGYDKNGATTRTG